MVDPARMLLPVVMMAMPLAPAAARDALGVFDSWGAFRDARPLRCFAVAEPARTMRTGGWRPFAAITTWPGLRVRRQLHVRLARVKRPGSPVMLTIGERRFLLASGGADAWAPDTRVDAAVVAAMRGGSSMSVVARDRAGRPFADTYRLRGAATAIDAAALRCARMG